MNCDQERILSSMLAIWEAALEHEDRPDDAIARLADACNPPSRVMQFVERAPMVKGRIDPDAVSATAYSWIVWEKPFLGPTRLEWIPPCRKRLEREGDYPASAETTHQEGPLL